VEIINTQTTLETKEERRSFYQLIIFLTVGFSGTILTLSLIFLLTELLQFHYLISVITGYSAGICNNYIWNRKITFRSTNPNIIIEYSNYVIINLIGMFVYTLTTFIITEFFYIWYFYSSILSVGFSAIADFLFSKFWVFRKKRK